MNETEQGMDLREALDQETATSAAPDEIENHDFQPNIVFVGRRELHGETAEMDAPKSLRDGITEFVDLPDSDSQKRGFYHPDANRIIRAFPRLYKSFVKKGEL
jgi:hypothetical protein